MVYIIAQVQWHCGLFDAMPHNMHLKEMVLIDISGQTWVQKEKRPKLILAIFLPSIFFLWKYVNLIVVLWLRFPLYCSFEASMWLNVLNSDSHRKIIAFKGLLNLLEIKLCNVTSSSTSSRRFILKWNIEGNFYDEFSEWCVLSKYLCLIIIDILFSFFQFLAWSSDCIFF